jgi:hypothetical protein
LDVAGRWAKFEPDFVLAWLQCEVQNCIRRVFSNATVDVRSEVSESVLRNMDTRNLFCYLDNINRLRGQSAGSFNLQLTLECLLIDWVGQLRDCRLEGTHV